MPIAQLTKSSLDDEQQLIQRAKTDPDAEAELTDKYMNMFYDIAKDYMFYSYDQNTGRSIPVSKLNDMPEKEDIVVASFEPFRKAIQEYDPSRGVKFITFAENGIRQYLDNIHKSQLAQKRSPTHDIEDAETGKKKRIVIKQPHLEDVSYEGKGGENEYEILDTIKDTISSRPDWQIYYDMLVEEVEDQLNSDIKKAVFRKLVEYGFMTKKLKQIGEDLDLNPSALSNILGRDIYPAVERVLGKGAVEKVKEEKVAE